MTHKLIVTVAIGVIFGLVVVFFPGACQAYSNDISTARCADYGAAVGLPFKSAKIKGWSECYLQCPDSWVPLEGFHGCHR